jgi:hypothetical protein
MKGRTGVFQEGGDGGSTSIVLFLFCCLHAIVVFLTFWLYD